MVKLKDIAKKCNVSITQVSRALNNNRNVSEETKRKVEQAALELGYVKNIFASNLVNKSSNNIAIIIEGIDYSSSEITNNNVFSMLQGINEFCSKHGYEPVIYIKNRYSNIEYITFCAQRLIPGLIIFGCNYDDEDYLNLTKTDFPCVSIDIANEGENKGCVIVNNSYYSQIAVNHLITNGCKHIALIAGKEHAHVTLERMSGYLMALHTNSIPVDNNLIVHADFDMQMAKEKTFELLENHPHIDGIFCMSDQMAIGALDAVKQMNLKIPEKIKLFGFDGNAICKYITPSLSTINQDFKKKGYAAAKLLTKILNEDKNIEKTVVVPCDVCLRESSQANNPQCGQ